MGWLLRLRITNSSERLKVFTQVLEAERLGKDMTVVRKLVEERFVVLSKPDWS